MLKEPRWIIFGLVMGDLLILLGIMVLSEAFHGLDPFSSRLVSTALPFLLGWLVSSLLVGPYRSTVIASSSRSALYAILTWMGGVLIGAALRQTAFFPGSSPVVFISVMLVAGSVLLSIWRFLYSKLVVKSLK